MASPDKTPPLGLDLFTRCYGCGREFKAGDRRLRFTLDEWSVYQGLEPTGIEVDIGLCDDCTEGGDFKIPELVADG